MRRVPIVALGDPGLRQAALAAGTNDFVATPLFVRDVVNVSRLLTLSHAVPNAPQPEVEVQARLSEYHGLFYLLRALAVTGRSGIILLSRGNKRAELRVADGAVMAVHIAGLQGLPALHQLLLWEEAALSLKFRAVPKRSNLHLSAQELLDECERFLRDFAHAARDLGAARCVYVPAGDRDPSTSGLQPAQLGPALRLFDGQRTLSDVIEDSPFRVFDTLRVVKRLLDAGVLAVKSTGVPAVDDAETHSMLEEWAVVPDGRGIVGDRRRTSRRLKTVGPGAGPIASPGAPAAFAPPPAAFAPPPAVSRADTPVGPIPLTQRKVAAAAGELSARKAAPTPASLAALAQAPTVQFKLDELPPAVAHGPDGARAHHGTQPHARGGARSGARAGGAAASRLHGAPAAREPAPYAAARQHAPHAAPGRLPAHAAAVTPQERRAPFAGRAQRPRLEEQATQDPPADAPHAQHGLRRRRGRLLRARGRPLQAGGRRVLRRPRPQRHAPPRRRRQEAAIGAREAAKPLRG